MSARERSRAHLSFKALGVHWFIVTSGLSCDQNETSSRMKQHQDLLNVKMTLDAEITMYRNLLEKVECRYSEPNAAPLTLNVRTVHAPS